MDKNVHTVFLSMALTLGLTRMAGEAPHQWPVWLIFAYFILRKTSYFPTDIRFTALAPQLFKPGSLVERMLDLLFGIFTLFLFLVVSYYVVEPRLFFLWYALALFVNIMWLILLYALIDPAQDQHPRLTVREMFRNFAVINGIEVGLCLLVGFWLVGKWQWPGLSYETAEPWIFGLAIGVLVFLMLIDVLIHKEFMFDPDYNPTSGGPGN